MFLLYEIACIPNGKRYIGLTSLPLARRWSQHLRDARIRRNRLLYNAIRKYGEAAFTIREVACAASRHDAKAMEIALIAQERTLAPSGYNATIGGEGTRGYTFPPETRAALSRAAKSRPAEVLAAQREFMRGLGIANRGKRLSAEHRAKMAASRVAFHQRRRAETVGGINGRA